MSVGAICVIFPIQQAVQPHSPECGSYRNRLYDQNTGRRTQEDPLGVAGGLNLYQFNGNDPVNKIDPTGTSEQCGWAWFEWTYRYTEGPRKGEISRVEYHQQWVCDQVADAPASAPSEYPAKGNRKPWEEEGFEGFGGKPPKLSERVRACAASEFLSPEDAAAGAAAIAPIPKSLVGKKSVMGPGVSDFTNLVSAGRLVAGDVKLPARIAGSRSLFGAAGRLSPYVAAGLLLFQAGEFAACVDSGNRTSGGGFAGAGAGGAF